jgi:Uma2 family endonuclease
MASTPRTKDHREVDYPTSDGKPMAETQWHLQVIMDLLATLKDHFAADPQVYIWGCLLFYYERGNTRARVAPDVFVVRGVPKLPMRDYYLLWQEGKAPDVVIEVTSKKTRSEDQKKKWPLYRDVLKVPEYFIFDPREEYLKPSTQGYRLKRGRYVPIEPVLGRLPSAGLDLHLERIGTELRLHDPEHDQRLLTIRERIVAAKTARAVDEAEVARLRAETALLRAETAQLNLETRASIAEAENERLRRENEALRRQLAGGV